MNNVKDIKAFWNKAIEDGNIKGVIEIDGMVEVEDIKEVHEYHMDIVSKMDMDEEAMEEWEEFMEDVEFDMMQIYFG